VGKDRAWFQEKMIEGRGCQIREREKYAEGNKRADRGELSSLPRKGAGNLLVGGEKRALSFHTRRVSKLTELSIKLVGGSSVTHLIRGMKGSNPVIHKNPKGERRRRPLGKKKMGGEELSFQTWK